jgi:hypothetical protein
MGKIMSNESSTSLSELDRFRILLQDRDRPLLHGVARVGQPHEVHRLRTLDENQDPVEANKHPHPWTDFMKLHFGRKVFGKNFISDKISYQV